MVVSAALLRLDLVIGGSNYSLYSSRNRYYTYNTTLL